jgi:hypothetical protein
MPRILINEIDKTTPGTPSSYENFSVLITGYEKTIEGEELTKAEEELRAVELLTKADEKARALKKLSDTAKTLKARSERADANGAYEFSSVGEFIETIGKVAPAKTVSTEHEGGQVTREELHCGNQMAYELLRQGYHIIYKPIESVKELVDENWWEAFRDKSNYDFRFITHGLLASTEPEPGLDDSRINAVDVAIKALAKIESDAMTQYGEQTEDNKVEIAEYKQTVYEDLLANAEINSGFMVNDKYYDTYDEAFAGTAAEKAELDSYKHKYVLASDINAVNAIIAELACFRDSDRDLVGKLPGRGDCVALIELDECKYAGQSSADAVESIATAIDEMSIAEDCGAYCAMTVPSIVYKLTDDEDYKNKKFPGAFHYLACFKSALNAGFAEWYAAAGYTRGVSSYVIDYATVKLGEIAINTLEPRNLDDDPATTQPKFACNVIANFRGSYYLWGNRTACALKPALGGNDLVASHFLNIRQLCTTIKKQLYVACRRFTFDPNSDTLWFNFVNAIKPTLEAMKADQGVRDYKIMKVYTDKKATLKAKIRIIPIEAVEDFDLEVSLEDSFGETTATVTE